MSSTSSKLLIWVFLGILIGIVGGYLYFDPQIQQDTSYIMKLLKEIEETNSDLTDLIADHNELTERFNENQEDYIDLKNDYVSLMSDKVSLENDYQEIESNYSFW